MNQFLQSLSERPNSHKIGFWIASVALASFLFWQYFYAELSTKEEELQTKIDKLNVDISQEKRLVRDLKKFREEVKQLDIKLKIVLRELPDKREIPNLLDSISGKAKEAGLEVNLFKPQPESYKEFYAEVPVSVSVEGTFHQIATFFDEVGRLSRIVNISQITVREPQITEEKVTVKTDCTVTTFRYLEESERIQATQDGDTSKRRRK